MIIKDTRGRTVSIEDAIDGSLDDSSHGSGQLEDIVGTQRLTGAMLGQIVAKLHAKGALSDSDVSDLLNYKFSAHID